MNLTLKNIKELKQQSESPLYKRVCNYVIENWSQYENKKHLFTDVLHYGCQSGVVGFLIYYSDTVKFYKQYKDEINELLYEAMGSIGTSDPKQVFGNNWEEWDPLALEVYNQNMLAWFGFEETLRNIGLNFEQLQECI